MKRRELLHISGCIHLADKVSPKFITQKNGFKHGTVTKWRTRKHLCLVQVLADIIKRLESYPGTSYDTPVNTVWVDDHITTITPQTKIKFLMSGTLSFGEECIGFSHIEVGTNST